MKKETKYFPLFLVLVLVYFYQAPLKGAFLAIGDGFYYFYPMMMTMTKQYKNFRFPLWNPYMFSGFPLFGSMQAGALYPFNVLLPLLLKPTTAFNVNIMLHYSFAGFFTFLYARQIGLKVFPSLVAGTVFSLLGYLPSHLQHPSVITSGAWIPLILYFFERLRQDPNVKDAIRASLIIALQVFAGHPQICFYTYIILFLYVLLYMFYQDPARRSRFALFAALSFVMGMLIALPQFVATYELKEMGFRAKPLYETFASYSFPIHMIPTFIFPFFYFYGGHGGEMWGPAPLLGQEAFIGTLPFLLAIVTVCRWRKNPHILFWGIIAVLSLLLALGGNIPPLHRLLFHLPVYNSFRGHSKHILELSLSLSILAGFGISFLQEREKEKRFQVALIIVLSGAIIGSLVSFTFFHDPIIGFFRSRFSTMHHLQLRWERHDIPEKALGITDPAIYIPLITMSINLACIIILSRARRRQMRNIFFSLIFLVIIAEAFLYRQRPLHDVTSSEDYSRQIYTLLSSDRSGRAVFFSANVFPLHAMAYGVSLIEGYDPLDIEDYRMLVPFLMSEEEPEIWRELIENNLLLSMLNTKYLIVDNSYGNLADIRWSVAKGDDGGTSFVSPDKAAVRNISSGYAPIYRKIAGGPLVSIFENVNALPRAYPILTLREVNSTAELKQSLKAFRFDPRREAGVSAKEFREIGNERFSPGDVGIELYSPDTVVLKTKFRGKGFVVLADQFYPGWRAYIDGSPYQSRIYKTDCVLRGVIVPGGEHTLVFKYVPRRIYISMFISGIFLALMIVVLSKKHPK